MTLAQKPGKQGLWKFPQLIADNQTLPASTLLAVGSSGLEITNADPCARRRPRHELDGDREFVRHESDVHLGCVHEWQRLFPAGVSLKNINCVFLSLRPAVRGK
jgi:hypothetical protein